MMVFAIMLVLLLYSVQNVTFKPGGASAESMRVQISLEEKNLANAISNTITQVYAQGPGAKATSYVKLTYLRDSQMIKKALEVEDPVIFITYGPNPEHLINANKTGNGTYITVLPEIGDANGSAFGGNKTLFWSKSLYSKNLAIVEEINGTKVWKPEDTRTVVGTSPWGGSTIYGLKIPPSQLPATLKIIVTWNPDNPDRWIFDSVKGILEININPGG